MTPQILQDPIDPDPVISYYLHQISHGVIKTYVYYISQVYDGYFDTIVDVDVTSKLFELPVFRVQVKKDYTEVEKKVQFVISRPTKSEVSP